MLGAFFVYAILSTTIHQRTGVYLVFEVRKTVQEVLNILSLAWILFQWVNLGFLLISFFPIVLFPCIVEVFTVSCCYYFCIKINKLKYGGENLAFSGQDYGALQWPFLPSLYQAGLGKPPFCNDYLCVCKKGQSGHIAALSCQDCADDMPRSLGHWQGTEVSWYSLFPGSLGHCWSVKLAKAWTTVFLLLLCFFKVWRKHF